MCAFKVYEGTIPAAQPTLKLTQNLHTLVSSNGVSLCLISKLDFAGGRVCWIFLFFVFAFYLPAVVLPPKNIIRLFCCAVVVVGEKI